LVVMGMVSIWAFVGGKYPDVPENIQPAASHFAAPAQLDQSTTMLSS